MLTQTNPRHIPDYRPIILPYATPQGIDDTPYKPASSSVATRQIALRSRSSLRGSLVTSVGKRIIRVESHIEKDSVLYFSSRPDVANIEEQPSPIAFDGTDGKPSRITFDLLVTFTNGRRVLVAVKDERHAIKHDVVGFLRQVAPQIPRHIADGVMLYTERSASPSRKSNARLIQAVRRDPPHPADQAVRDVIPHIQGAVRIGDLVAATTHGAAAFRAIVRLIARRMILMTSDERISHRSLVTVAQNRGEVA